MHDGHDADELFAVFREMVTPLHDAHVAVLAGDTVVRPGPPGHRMPTAELDAKVTKFIEERDLEGAGYCGTSPAAGSATRTSPASRAICGSPASPATPRTGLRADSAELDGRSTPSSPRTRTARLKGLIIDLRINGGGSDELGLHSPARLTDRPYFAYAKRARNDPADPARFTRPQPMYVRPAARAPLHRPGRRTDRRLDGQRG